MSCESKVKAQIPERLQRQTWVPSMVSKPGFHLIAGIAFRDTREQKAYKLWSEKQKSVYLTSDLKTMKETLQTWDPNKACDMTVSTNTMTPPPYNSKG